MCSYVHHVLSVSPTSSQSLLKKHEVVMADVDSYQITIKILAEQSQKCKVFPAAREIIVT